MHTPVHRLALATAALVLLPAGLAQATTYTVDMGPPLANQKAFESLRADANAYFPNALTIHRGDKVKFVPTSFHTVDFPKKGGSPIPLISPAGTISGDNDAAGNPYWFNGQPNLQFSPVLLNLGYGKSFTYNGSKEVQSGLPIVPKPKPMTVKFAKTGTFTYYCSVHAGMKAKIHVVAPTAKAPSVKSVAKAVKKQVAAAIKTAKALQNPTVAANTVQVGNSGKGGVEIFGFFPAQTTVPVGTTLTFSMSPKTLDNHTATTGPGDPEQDPTSFLGKMAGSIGGQPPFDEAGVYPSDPPAAGPASLTPTLHGNGFWGTGIMGGPAAKGLPSSGKVTITAPGTYTFYCLIHPFMKTVITAS